MRLRAHPNVVCLAEQRRRMAEQRRAADLTDEPVRFQMSVPPGGVMFVGWQTKPADTPSEPPRTRSSWLGRLLRAR